MSRAWVLVAALVAAGCGAGHVSRRPASTEQFGASVNLLFNGRNLSDAEIGSQLAALEATGATLARSDALWEATEPAPPVNGVHSYNWSFDDRIAASLAAHRLRWLPIVDYSARWGQSIPGQDHSPPTLSADYAAYAGALAARYGPDGSFWREHPELPSLPVQAFEIWNEPNSSFFWVPRPDPARYAELYDAARTAIHAEDPTATVLIGGLANGPPFVAPMLAAVPSLRIDGVAIHPYDVSPAAVAAKVAETRQMLDVLGLKTAALYVTEVGWTTSPPGALDYLPETLRPAYIEQTLRSLDSCGVAASIVYTWFSPRQNPRDSQQWFGLSGSEADVRAFAAGLREATLQRERC